MQGGAPPVLCKHDSHLHHSCISPSNVLMKASCNNDGSNDDTHLANIACSKARCIMQGRCMWRVAVLPNRWDSAAEQSCQSASHSFLSSALSQQLCCPSANGHSRAQHVHIDADLTACARQLCEAGSRGSREGSQANTCKLNKKMRCTVSVLCDMAAGVAAPAPETPRM